MFINIIFDFKIFFVKLYSLNKQNQNFIDQKFDKLHRKKNEINYKNYFLRLFCFCNVTYYINNQLKKIKTKKTHRDKYQKS